MGNRRILSYALFIVALFAFLLVGALGGEWLFGLLLGLVLLIAGVVFYRRGK
jgi:glucose dehydrogenase